MRWTKLRALAEERLAPELRGRIAFHSTRYGNCTCGRFWIAVDGHELANMCTRSHYNRSLRQRAEVGEDSGTLASTEPVEPGEFSRQQAYRAIWEFVHELSIEQALVSEDPLHQALAVIDSRVGQRRLRKMDADSLHPLVRSLLLFRLSARDEGQNSESTS